MSTGVREHIWHRDSFGEVILTDALEEWLEWGYAMEDAMAEHDATESAPPEDEPFTSEDYWSC